MRDDPPSRHIDPEQLAGIVAFLLAKAGCDAEIAAEVSDNLVDAELCGHASHGIRLLKLYVERLRSGVVEKAARPQVVSSEGAILRIDGNKAFGQIVGAFAVREGIKLAKQLGVSVVATRASGHFGRNGKWPELAAEQGFASIHFVNAPGALSSVVPHGGREARLTSNPIALGAPRSNGEHVIVDFSTAEISVNSIKLAFEKGQKLPTRCIVKNDGSFTDEPADFLEAASRAVLAFGGYKGFALGVFADIFAGTLTGGGCHVDAEGRTHTNNMLSIFLNVESMIETQAYEAELQTLVSWIEATPAHDPAEPVLVPGARSRILRRQVMREGLRIEEHTKDIITALSAKLGVASEVSTMLSKAVRA